METVNNYFILHGFLIQFLCSSTLAYWIYSLLRISGISDDAVLLLMPVFSSFVPRVGNRVEDELNH